MYLIEDYAELLKSKTIKSALVRFREPQTDVGTHQFGTRTFRGVAGDRSDISLGKGGHEAGIHSAGEGHAHLLPFAGPAYGILYCPAECSYFANLSQRRNRSGKYIG